GRGHIEERNNPGCLSPSEGGVGGAFLAPFPRRTRLLHLPAQRLHLGDVESGIMSDDDHIGGLNDPVERRDEFLLSRSVHCKLFIHWRPLPESPVSTGCPRLTLHQRSQDAATHVLPLARNMSPTRAPTF